MFLYQLQNTESFKPTWDEVLDQFPEVAVADLLKFSDKKPTCLPELFWGNSSCDVEDKMADAEKCNHRFKVSIDENECPGFADALLQNLSLSDGASFFCTAKDKDFRFIPNIADLPEYQSSEVNILTSQSLFSRLCSEVQSLKVLGISGSAALAIAIEIGYMQRYDGGKYSA